MITITYEKLVAALALFTACCVAGGWLIKIIKGIRKPGNDIAKKLHDDNERIKRLRKDVDYNNDAIKLLLRSEMSILGHLQSGNNTGEITQAKKDIEHFLLNN